MGLIHIETLILSSRGLPAPAGKFLHEPDYPFTHSYDVRMGEVEIAGAGPFSSDEAGPNGEFQPILLMVANREKAPLVCREGTKVWSIDKEGWTECQDVLVGERLRIPEIFGPVGHASVVPTWATVKRVMKAEKPYRMERGGICPWLRMSLKNGRSFATVSAWVMV